jgi:hypothetical protein
LTPQFPNGIDPLNWQSWRTRFESIAERKIRRRQLTDDGNVEISGRDLCEALRA